MNPNPEFVAASANSPVVLCAGTLPNADFVNRVNAANAAGYAAITLFPEQYLNARHREKLSIADMRCILEVGGVEVASIDPLLDWFGPYESRAEKLMYEAAVGLGAPAINIAPAFCPDISREEIIEALLRLSQRAAKHQMNIDLEFLPWSIIPDLQTVLDLIGELNQNNVFATLDCLHFHRSGSVPGDLESLGQKALQRISNIQLCDIGAQPQVLNWQQRLSATRVMLGTGLNSARTMGLKTMIEVASKAHHSRDDAAVLMQEATCTRLLPGQGDIPLREILQTLEKLECRPLRGLEIFSLKQNRLSPHTAAKQAMAAYRGLEP